MRSGIPGTGNSPVFWTSISTFFSGWFGPCHVMRFSAVFNHFLRLHVHEVAAGPPAHHYGSEMHPHMIVDSPMVGGSIGTEWAKGVISLNCGGDSIHNVSSRAITRAMAAGLTTSCSPMFCSFPYTWWSQSISIPSQSMSTSTANSGVHLSPLGIPCTIRKLDLIIC